MPLYGSTDYNSIGRIDLFPNAFTSEEELIKTILHEKCHVLQLKKIRQGICAEKFRFNGKTGIQI